MKIRATPEDSLNHIFGAGAEMWSWWGGFDFTHDGSDLWDNVTTWQVVVLAENPDGDEPEYLKFTVDHASIIKAMRRIWEEEIGTETLQRECGQFLVNPEHCDFDADSADNVIQVATFGKIIYG